MKKKVLIVYENAGMGHLRVAKIIEDIIAELNDVKTNKITMCEMVNSPTTKLLVNLWNTLIRNNLLRTADILLNFCTRLIFTPFAALQQTSVIHNKLDEIKPDIIVSTYPFVNKELSSYANEKGIKLIAFLPDISTFMDYVCPNSLHLCYFNETKNALNTYELSSPYYSHNIDRQSDFKKKATYIMRFYHFYLLEAYKHPVYKNIKKSLGPKNNVFCKAIGPIAEKKHFSEKPLSLLKRKHNIQDGADNIIIASGSIGGKFITNIIDIIHDNFSKKINLIIICGKDENTYHKIKNTYYKNPIVNVIPFQFTEEFNELLYIADCIIVRPSAGIFMESLLSKTPIIVLEPVTSNDKGSLLMIDKYQLGEICKDLKAIPGALVKILDNKEIYQNNIRELLKEYPNTYEEKKEIIRELIFNAPSLKE